MSNLLKNGGWRGIGKFVAVIDDDTHELRIVVEVTQLPPTVKSQKAAKAQSAEQENSHEQI